MAMYTHMVVECCLVLLLLRVLLPSMRPSMLCNDGRLGDAFKGEGVGRVKAETKAEADGDGNVHAHGGRVPSHAAAARAVVLDAALNVVQRRETRRCTQDQHTPL